MKVILLNDVKKLGRKYEVKEVASGYASNFLFPNKLATLASDAKQKELEVLTKRAEEERKIQEELLAKNLDSLKGAKATIVAKANDKGHLFQGLHNDEIVEALARDAHVTLESGMINLKEPIKATGEFDIPVTVGKESATFTLVVNPE